MASEHFRPPDFHPSRPGLVLPVPLDRTGKAGPTVRQARGKQWRRSSCGLSVRDDVDRTPEQRILEAAAVLPAYGGVTGWAALRWLGGSWFSGLGHGGRTQLPVWLATSCADIRRQPGIEVSAEGLDPRDLTEVDGVRLTTAVRSVCFEMRYASSDCLAAAYLDMAAFHDLVSIEEARQYARTLGTWTGIPRCRGSIGLSDENCWSIQEALMRGVWTRDAGFARPLCNVPVFDRFGRHVATPDLLDPVSGVVGEYDGRHHLQLAQRTRDVGREADFRALDLEYVTMLASDGPDPRAFLLRLEDAYRRAKCLPESRRPWTLSQPAWWVDTSTVDTRRSLTPEERRIWLGRRAS
jgi:hypothetical protein